MPTKKKHDPVQEKLDRIIDLLEDLLVVEGARGGVGSKDLRTIAKIGQRRVSRITKHIKSL